MWFNLTYFPFLLFDDKHCCLANAIILGYCCVAGTGLFSPARVSFAVILRDALLAPGCRVSGGCGLARGCGVGLGATGGPRVGLQGWVSLRAVHRSLRDSVLELRARVSRSGWLETAFLTGPQQGRCSCCGHSGLFVREMPSLPPVPPSN